jgi:serine/threonine protein kinase
LQQPHIAEYHHSQGFETGSNSIEIFMTLYSGSIEEYLLQNPFRRDTTLIEGVFKHTLKALTFIAHHGIIHRDVKPANILYHYNEKKEPQFVLADFGLSREQHLAQTAGCGTQIYMAPEVRTPGMQQTHKADVYSLGVTILALARAAGFDETQIRTLHDLSVAIEAGLRVPNFALLAPMLSHDPAARPSAQKIFLSIWQLDPEAMRLPPKEVEPPSPATAVNPAPSKPKKREQQQPLRRRHGEPAAFPAESKRRRLPLLTANHH